jgi:hypothetical protein
MAPLHWTVPLERARERRRSAACAGFVVSPTLVRISEPSVVLTLRLVQAPRCYGRRDGRSAQRQRVAATFTRGTSSRSALFDAYASRLNGSGPRTAPPIPAVGRPSRFARAAELFPRKHCAAPRPGYRRDRTASAALRPRPRPRVVGKQRSRRRTRSRETAIRNGRQASGAICQEPSAITQP